MKRKIYTLASVFALSLAGFTAAAQQLPNAGFEENWGDCTPWTSNGNSKTKGTQPGSWNISHVIGINGTGATEVGSEDAGYSGSKSVKLINTANPTMASQIVPAYLTLGTTWSTSTMTSNRAGGTFGGMEFSYKPDAVSFYYKRSHGTDNAEELATVVAYSWKGSWIQKDVPGNIVMFTISKREVVDMVDRDRCVVGVSVEGQQGGEISQTGTLVASVNYSIEGDAAEWTPLTLPLGYVSDETPEKFNIIFSASDYFASADNVGKDNALWVDDVKLIYHSRLEALALEGVTGFDKGVYNYNVDLKTLPTKEEVLAVATADGKSATVDATIDETEKTVTITVTNVDADEDGQSSHTYTLQYKKAVATDYPGYLSITMTMDEGAAAVALNDPATVTISDYGDGTCDFLLPNLTVMGTLEMGDIMVENVTVTEAEGVKTYSGSVANMELNYEIKANVEIAGTIDADGKANLEIAVVWIGGFGSGDVPIGVTFTTDKVQTEAEGYIHVKKGDDWLAEKLAANLTITPGLDDSLTPDYEITLSGVAFTDGETTVELGDITVHATAVDESGETYTYSSEESEVQLGNGKTATVSMTGTYDPVTGLYNVTFTVTVEGETYVFGFTTEAIGASVTDAVESATLVYGATGAIVVESYTGNVAVYAADGRLAARATVDGRAEIAVAKGLYVVRTDSKAQKVAVK